MSRHHLPARPARRSLADRLYGVLSLLILLLLLVGIPAALVALRGNPLPDSAPDPGMLLDRLVAPDDGSLFLAALTWLGWLAWASFALSVAIEAVGQVRGLPSPQLPALGPQQRAASVLVAAAALLFTAPLLHTPAAAASAGTASGASTTASIQPDPLPSRASGTAIAAAAAAQAPAAEQASRAAAYTVRPGDSLWRIAETLLGDGARYSEIAELNYDRHQPDGRALTADHWLAPGWTLILPHDAAAPAAPADPEQPSTTVVVEPGDTLWQIAQEALGDGGRYHEIAEASTQVQPDGARLGDPDLIRPGWELTVPGPPHPPAERHPAETLSPPTAAIAPTAPATSPQQARTQDAPPIAPAHVVPDAVQPLPSVTSLDTRRADAGQASAPVEEDAGQDEPVEARTAAGIGASLAAGLLALLAGRRVRQQRRRRPGQRIAMPDPALVPAELELRLVEDPDGRLRIDHGLRTLSLLLAEGGAALPTLRLVRLSAGQLELYLADPVVLPAPFTATGDPTVWTLPADAPLPAAAELTTVPAPYPSLATLGHDLDGAHVLVDLEHCGSLAVTGDEAATTAVLAALATELATSVWADDLQVTLVGCLPELPDGLGTGRLRHVTGLDELLRVLERRSAAVRASLASAGAPDLQHARTATGHRHGDSWTPEIVLLSQPLAPADRERLQALLHDLPRAGLAAVTTGDSSLSEWTLSLDAVDSGMDDDVAVLAPVGLALRPQRLTDRDLTQLLDLLAVTDLPAHPAEDGTFIDLVADEPTLADLGTQLIHHGTGETDLRAGNTRPSLSVPPEDHSPAPATAEVEQEGRPLYEAIPTGHIDEDELGPGPAGRPADSEEPAGAPGHRPPPLVQLLGSVELLHPRGTVERSKQRQLTEIAAYLCLHPGRDHTHLSEAIWPGARTLDNTRNTALSKLRKWLGTNTDGEDYVPRVLDDGYRLHPDVRSDWQLWHELLPDGPAAADTAALTAALELIQDRPFAGTNPRRYAWAERHRQDMISAIVDAAHELAHRALLEGNAPLARHAAAAGLQADPGAELLWRDALRAEWLAGDLTGLTTTADRLSALADELGDDLESETLELLDELLNRRSRQTAAP
jgi:nucleoid-associated protein YgaU